MIPQPWGVTCAAARRAPLVSRRRTSSAGSSMCSACTRCHALHGHQDPHSAVLGLPGARVRDIQQHPAGFGQRGFSARFVCAACAQTHRDMQGGCCQGQGNIVFKQAEGGAQGLMHQTCGVSMRRRAECRRRVQLHQRARVPDDDKGGHHGPDGPAPGDSLKLQARARLREHVRVQAQAGRGRAHARPQRLPST